MLYEVKLKLAASTRVNRICSQEWFKLGKFCFPIRHYLFCVVPVIPSFEKVTFSIAAESKIEQRPKTQLRENEEENPKLLGLELDQ